MSEQFKVGEIAIICNTIYHPENEGLECVVTKPLASRLHLIKGTQFMAYVVELSDGKTFALMPHQLRKKHPPRSAKSIMREAINKAKQPQMVPA